MIVMERIEKRYGNLILDQCKKESGAVVICLVAVINEAFDVESAKQTGATDRNLLNLSIMPAPIEIIYEKWMQVSRLNNNLDWWAWREAGKVTLIDSCSDLGLDATGPAESLMVRVDEFVNTRTFPLVGTAVLLTPQKHLGYERSSACKTVAKTVFLDNSGWFYQDGWLKICNSDWVACE